MTKQRIDSKLEQGFSILLVALVAFAIVYVILRVSHIEQFGFSPHTFEEEIKKTDVQ